MKKNNFQIAIVLLACFWILGCSEKQSAILEQQPLIDFRALTTDIDSTSAFHQVLLRIQLLNSNEDITKYGVTTPEAHQRRLNYYLFHFKDDISLIAGNDTIPCYDAHAERTYMNLPYFNFILTFDHPVASGDQIMVNDIVYSNQTLIIDVEQNLLSE